MRSKLTVVKLYDAPKDSVRKVVRQLIKDYKKMDSIIIISTTPREDGIRLSHSEMRSGQILWNLENIKRFILG